MYYFNDKGEKVVVKGTKENFQRVKENFDADPKGNNMMMIYVAIGVIVLIGIIAGIWYWNSKENYSPSSSETFAGNNPNMKFSQMGFTYL